MIDDSHKVLMIDDQVLINAMINALIKYFLNKIQAHVFYIAYHIVRINVLECEDLDLNVPY